MSELDNALKLYQEGVQLSTECLKKLTDIEQEVYQLIEKNGKLNLTKFNTNEAED